MSCIQIDDLSNGYEITDLCVLLLQVQMSSEDGEEDEDEDAPEIEDHYNDPDEDDDAFDDDKLTEESYRTTFEDPENLGLDDAEDVADDEEY